MSGSLEGLVQSPITALVLALFFGALATSGRFSMTATRILFVICWVVAIFGLRALPTGLLAVIAFFLGASFLILDGWLKHPGQPNVALAHENRLQDKQDLALLRFVGESDRRELIRQARKFVARIVGSHPADYEHFRRELRADIAFLNLRPYLSAEFLNKLSSRIVFVPNDNSRPAGLAGLYTQELERLEREWGLLPASSNAIEKPQPRLTPARLAIARDLDDLYAEGVGERNQLIPTIDRFNAVAAREKLVEWSDRVLAKCDDQYVAMREKSAFRTLNLFEAKFHDSAGKSDAQKQLEAMWTEKLNRLQVIIRKVGS